MAVPNIHALPGASFGAPIELGLLVSGAGTSVNNTTTAATFTIPPNSTITLQAVGAGSWKVGTTDAVAATAAASFDLAAGQSVTFTLPDGYLYIAWIGSTTTCKVFRNLV